MPARDGVRCGSRVVDFCNRLLPPCPWEVVNGDGIPGRLGSLLDADLELAWEAARLLVNASSGDDGSSRWFISIWPVGVFSSSTKIQPFGLRIDDFS